MAIAYEPKLCIRIVGPIQSVRKRSHNLKRWSWSESSALLYSKLIIKRIILLYSSRLFFRIRFVI